MKGGGEVPDRGILLQCAPDSGMLEIPTRCKELRLPLYVGSGADGTRIFGMCAGNLKIAVYLHSTTALRPRPYMVFPAAKEKKGIDHE